MTDTQLSRRSVLRRGTALTIGAGAAGAGASTINLGPVGRSQAIAPAAIPIAWAGAKAATMGLAIAGTAHVLLGDNSELKLDPTEVATDATDLTIYEAVESASLAAQGGLDYIGKEVGVMPDGSTDYQDNDLAHTSVEHMVGTAARAWDNGALVGEATAESRKAARLVTISSEWSIINLWNDWVGSVASAIKAQYSQHGKSNSPLGFGDSEKDQIDAQPISEIGDPDYIEPVITDDSDNAIVIARDLSEQMPLQFEDVPEEERPAGGYKILEIVVNNHPDYNQAPKVLTPHPNTTGLDGTKTDQAKVDHDGLSTTFDVSKIQSLLQAVSSIRDNIEGSLDDTVGNVYQGLESGDITVQDVMSGRMMYQQYEPPEGSTRSAIELAATGRYSPPDYQDRNTRFSGEVDAGGSYTNSTEDGGYTYNPPNGTETDLPPITDVNQITVAVGPEDDPTDIYTGVVFLDADSAQSLGSGDVLQPDDYNEFAIINDAIDGGQETVTDQRIEVLAVPDTRTDEEREAGEPANVEYGETKKYVASTPNTEEIATRVKQSEEQYDKLTNAIEALESSGGAGGNLLDGVSNRGLGIILLILAVVFGFGGR